MSSQPQSPDFLQRRKFFLFLPVLVLPFLSFIFYSMGGGQDALSDKKPALAGFNVELPGAKFDKKKVEKHKLDLYKQADLDSQRRREFARIDPYAVHSKDSIHKASPLAEDTAADELIQKLARLQQTIHHPATIASPPIASVRPRILPMATVADTIEADPQLEKLNTMLDKIIKIQHPVETAAPAPVPIENVLSSSLPAVVQEDQVLVAGATIALRLTEAAVIGGVAFPKDQLAYGVVSISNDRMLININSIRREQAIFMTSLQVYDLDGLPGIHIPGDLGRETAKESTDQTVHSMEFSAIDPSPAGQAVNAGVLAAKSLLSRKVRMVRVAVRAGYEVLLRSTKSPMKIVAAPEHLFPDSIAEVPDAASFTPFLHHGTSHAKMELMLQGIYLRDSLLWMVLRLENHNLVDFTAGYVHWSIRDRKRARRTAIQDIQVQPLYTSPTDALSGHSSKALLAAFRPFALPADKELVLQLSEGNGARDLVLVIGEKELLKARQYEQR